MAKRKIDKSIDKASLEMMEKAARDGVTTAFDRASEMSQCAIGAAGSCCKHCGMGPCRVLGVRGEDYRVSGEIVDVWQPLPWDGPAIAEAGHIDAGH